MVSIIIPTYNRAAYLEKAIQSVVNQTYQNFEILVVDDGSTTNYAELICNKYPNCYYYNKKNGGLSSARNYGVKKAKGEYIAFLDDDDFWKQDKLEKQVSILKAQKNIDCVHSSAIVVDEEGNETGKTIGASKHKEHKRSGNVFWNALGVWVVKSPTPLIRKKVFTKEMFFDETIKVGEDLDFYWRMFFKHEVLYINEPLAYYRDYSDMKRLSIQKEKYLGIEKKIYNNFVKMRIKNPFVLQRIAIILLRTSIRRNNSIESKKKINFNLFETIFFAKKNLKQLNLRISE